ncbi:MAG: ArsR family transcriptional regulator [Glaciihabitans sp.]|jgi:predicted NBD/HSP70 family sugar kinase|nr:ArsR family transcriptional regulator [Glaciihabitans sp.]
MSPRPPGTRDGSGQPGSQSALRLSNQERIIRTLLDLGPLTQAELSRQTGLSTATVSNIVRALLDRELVTTSPVTSSGRRAVAVSVSGNGAVAVGIDFGRRHTRVVVASLAYELIAEEAIETDLEQDARGRLDAAATLLAHALAKADRPRASVLGVGVGIPGSIDLRTGTAADSSILPEWDGVSEDAIASRLKLPIYLDNDANLGALAEVTWGPHTGTANLVFVKIATGIGAGLILNGTQHRGSIGVTGELGHTPIHEHGLLCRCGNRGCLETVASTSMMLELLRRSSVPSATTGDIVRNGLAADRATLRVIDDAGLAIGRSLATIANVVNPEKFIIGGPLAGLGEVFLAPIRQGFERYAIPVVADATILAMSSLGDKAEALGAASLVLQQPGSHTFAMGSLSSFALTS